MTTAEPPRVLLLLPTNTYKAHDFLQAAERLGVETVVGSERPQALEGLSPGRSLTLPLSDPGAAALAIESFARRHPLRAVVPTDDQTALVAAHASALLGLPHNPPAAALAARRKDVLRRLLEAGGVRTPRHRLIAAEPAPDDAALAEIAARQSYPCVLKPTFLSASRGVIRADGPEEFAAAFRRIEALLRLPDLVERGVPDDKVILVEEFITGAEVALEGLLSGGRLRVLAIFDKPDPLDGPYFEETLYVTPSRHEESAQRAIVDAVSAGARAIGLQEGPVHAEVRLGPLGPCLIELAARSIGGLCGRVLRFGASLSLEEVILAHALGLAPGRAERETRPAGVMMMPVPGRGILREVRGLAAAREVPGVEDVTILATLGQPLVPWPEGSSYPGFIFARGATPAEVESVLRRAHRLIEMVID